MQPLLRAVAQNLQPGTLKTFDTYTGAKSPIALPTSQTLL